MSPSFPNSNGRGRAILALIWFLALGAMVIVRLRLQWPAYKALHKQLADLGWPDWVRNLDAFLIFTLAAVLGAFLAHRLLARSRSATSISIDDETRTPLSLLGLRRGRPGWPLVVAVALAPMLIGGAVQGFRTGNLPAPAEIVVPAVANGVIRAAIMEELFFRGLLVGIAAAAALGWMGRAFWINAACAAALFSVAHTSWTIDAALAKWPTLLVTFIGGLWFAWLLAKWRTLWPLMLLHGGMNLGWLLAAAKGGAGGGGLIENLLRAATIALATWLTIRATKTVAE